jgi:hypothetical protein
MSLSQRTRYSIDAIPAFESKSTERKFDRVKVNTKKKKKPWNSILRRMPWAARCHPHHSGG